MRSPLAASAVLSLLLATGSEATVKVVDTAGDVSQKVWSQAKADGFDVAIPRGVFEACSVRGTIYLLCLKVVANSPHRKAVLSTLTSCPMLR